MNTYYWTLVAALLLLTLAMALSGCVNSLPASGFVECDETYRQPVWTGTRWRECV